MIIIIKISFKNLKLHSFLLFLLRTCPVRGVRVLFSQTFVQCRCLQGLTSAKVHVKSKYDIIHKFSIIFEHDFSWPHIDEFRLLRIADLMEYVFQYKELIWNGLYVDFSLKRNVLKKFGISLARQFRMEPNAYIPEYNSLFAKLDRLLYRRHISCESRLLCDSKKMRFVWKTYGLNSFLSR